MAHDQNGNDTAGGPSSNRRTFLKTVGLAATAAGGSALFGTHGAAQTVIDLGEKGLQNGDLIDPYLEQYFNDGAEVHVPAGEYDFEGGGMGYGMANAALIGSPEGVVFNRPDNPEQTVRPSILATEGTVRLENITYRGIDGVAQSRWRVGAAEGARMEVVNVNFPDGSVDSSDSLGLYTGTDHGGDLWIKSCYVEGFGNVAIYVSDPYVGENGRIVIEDCVVRNSNASMIRFAPDNSVIRGCYFEATERPPSEQGYGTNLRAIKFDDAGDNVVVEDCDFYWSDLGNNTIEFHSRGAGGSGVFRNCRFYNDSDSAIMDPDWDVAGNWTGENLHITGSGTSWLPEGFDAVRGADAQEPNTEWSVWTPVDGDGSAPTDGADGSGSSGSSLPNTITISGGSASNLVDYSFSVSGALEGTTSVNSEDSISGTDAQGAVAGGADTYRFEGDVTAFDATGDVTVEVNGQAVDPAQLGADNGQTELPNTISVSGGSATNLVDYSFSVSEALAEGENVNAEDGIQGTSAQGGVAGGTDTYRFAGEVTSFQASDAVTVRINGETVDESQFGGSTNQVELSNTLRIAGGSPSNVIDYSLSVSEALGEQEGINSDDVISGTSAEGTVAGGADTYAFAGDVTAFNASGDVTVEVNGQSVDPSALGSDAADSSGDGTDGSSDGTTDGSTSDGSTADGSSDGSTQEKVLVIDGTGDASETARYVVSVTGTLSRDEERSMVDTQASPWDSLQDNVESDRVVGIVGNGVDAYRFTGSLTTLDVRGEASIDIIRE